MAVLAALLVATVLPACTGGGGGYELSAVFDKAISLYPGSQVKVLGLPAGTITDVTVDGAVVRVQMRIDDDIPVPDTVVATIVPASLIGERYVQLSPAWTEGTPRIERGAEIPLERTSIPVEPDEALAALKAFLDALDPNATGRLVRNLAEDLDGNGAALNRAVKELADLTTTLAAKSEELGGLVDNFDRLTATLVTREARIGEALRDFAVLTDILASERASLERLLAGLATLSRDGLALTSEHRAALDRDIEVLTRTLGLVDANLDNVGRLLDATPLLLGGPDYSGRDSGLIRAVDPEYHRVDLRNSASPLISSLLDGIGIPVAPICVPLDTSCASGAGTPGAPAGPPAPPGAPGPPGQGTVGAALEPNGGPQDSSREASDGGAGLLRPGQGVARDLDPEEAGAGGSILGWLRAAARAVSRVVA